jgi:hypothetical protein
MSDFDELNHPRGQPKNAGQFVKADDKQMKPYRDPPFNV